MQGTVEEIFKKYYTIFSSSLENMKKSQAMDTWVVQAKRAYDNIKTLETTAGWNTEDYNRMVFWLTYLDAFKGAIEDTHGGLLKLKADYPNQYSEVSAFVDKINKIVDTLKGLSTEAGDLKLQRKYENLADWFKEKFELSNQELEAIGNVQIEALDEKSLNLFSKWLHSTDGKTYKLNQLFPHTVNGKTVTEAWREQIPAHTSYGSETVGPLTGAGNVPILAIAAAGIGAYFMLRG
jgi:hypothetical protein